MTVTDKDRDILARTIWGEAMGEGLDGMIATAWTIRNRVFDGKAKSWWGAMRVSARNRGSSVAGIQTTRTSHTSPKTRPPYSKR